MKHGLVHKMDHITLHERFISGLISRDEDVEFVDYVSRMTKVVGMTMEEKFASEMAGLIVRRGYCIPHEKLAEYDVIVMDGKHASSDIRKFLNTCHLEENTGYEIRKVKTESGQTRNHYWFTADAFSVCLQRSQRTKKYNLWFIHIYRCAVFYHAYRIALKSARGVKVRDEVIDSMKVRLEGYYRENEELVARLAKGEEITAASIQAHLDRYYNDNQETLARIGKNNKLIEGKLHELVLVARKVTAELKVAVEDRVPKAKESKRQDLVIIKLNHPDEEVFKFAIRWGYRENWGKAIGKLRRSCPGLAIVKIFREHPNPANLVNRFVERMGSKIETDMRDKLFSPAGITEGEFMEAIEEVNREKYKVEV